VLYPLAFIGGLALLAFILAFARAFAHPDQHRDWQWENYGIRANEMQVALALRPFQPQPSKPLLCRVIAPDGTLWESSAAADPVNLSLRRTWRMYPEDFKCPKCGQPPSETLADAYEVIWLEPRWGPLRRPLVRYMQHAPEREQAPETNERAS
jgi:hypothetical protein